MFSLWLKYKNLIIGSIHLVIFFWDIGYMTHRELYQLVTERLRLRIHSDLFKRRAAMKTTLTLFYLLLCIFILTSVCSCGIKFTQKGETFLPYTGKVKVFWKEHGVPADPNTYDLIGTVSGRVTWCGVTKGRYATDLHNELINEAGKHGGNGIILYCGEVGSVGQCDCYGDIIRFKK